MVVLFVLFIVFLGLFAYVILEDRSNDNNKGANIAGAAGLPGRVTFQI